MEGGAQHAEELLDSADLHRILRKALRDERMRQQALSEPDELLSSGGVDVPDGLEMELFEQIQRGKPVPPDGEHPFCTLQLFRCRTYWVRERDDDGKPTGPLTQVQDCLGFKVVPRPWPPIA